MLRKRIMAGLAVLALLGIIAGCGGETGGNEAANTLNLQGYVTVDAYHYDEATGSYIHFYHDESSNLLTTIGKNWIEDQLGDSPGTDPAKWISLSTSSSAPDAAWTQIPTEIAADGLERAAGTYASTGDGVWTISKTFTATGAHTNVQLTGLNWASCGSGNLMAANTFTAVTLATDDSLTVTWTLTLS